MHVRRLTNVKMPVETVSEALVSTVLESLIAPAPSYRTSG